MSETVNINITNRSSRGGGGSNGRGPLRALFSAPWWVWLPITILFLAFLFLFGLSWLKAAFNFNISDFLGGLLPQINPAKWIASTISGIFANFTAGNVWRTWKGYAGEAVSTTEGRKTILKRIFPVPYWLTTGWKK